MGISATAMPITLIKVQSALKLSSNDIVVILNLAMHRWRREDAPYLRSSIVAKRSGLSARTIQRSLHKMQNQERIRRERKDGKAYFYLDGLNGVLQKFSEKYGWESEKFEWQGRRVPHRRPGEMAL